MRRKAKPVVFTQRRRLSRAKVLSKEEDLLRKNNKAPQALQNHINNDDTCCCDIVAAWAPRVFDPIFDKSCSFEHAISMVECRNGQPSVAFAKQDKWWPKPPQKDARDMLTLVGHLEGQNISFLFLYSVQVIMNGFWGGQQGWRGRTGGRRVRAVREVESASALI